MRRSLSPPEPLASASQLLGPKSAPPSWIYVTLQIKSRAWFMLGKHSTKSWAPSTPSIPLSLLPTHYWSHPNSSTKSWEVGEMAQQSQARPACRQSRLVLSVHTGWLTTTWTLDPGAPKPQASLGTKDACGPQTSLQNTNTHKIKQMFSKVEIQSIFPS